MADSLDDNARAATSALIISKRDALVSERNALLERRTEILSRLRRVDRELADCRAAARLFSLDIEFPADERPDLERELIREREMREFREMTLRQREALERERARLAAVATASLPGPRASPQIGPVPPLATMSAEPSAVPLTRPPIREIVLSQLRAVGASGSKSAILRDHIERTYGAIVHEKTVGMTLYRLLKEGLIRRDGHTWFFGSAQAETENPGVVAPGFDNRATQKGDQHHVAHGR
jgi:hypothetical protein